MLVNLLVSLKHQKLYKEAVVVKEDNRSNYFYLIKSGEFEMTKKLIKPTSNRDSKEAFIDDEMVRVKDLTHNIYRNTDEVLDQRNYFIEGNKAGFFGLGNSVPTDMENSDLVQARTTKNREKF